jgi:hypothetical protein
MNKHPKEGKACRWYIYMKRSFELYEKRGQEKGYESN